MMQNKEDIREILKLLEQIQNEDLIPKNVKIKLSFVYNALAQEGVALAIRIDKSIQELDEISEDQFVPIHVRTQIWGIVSRLECI